MMKEGEENERSLVDAGNQRSSKSKSFAIAGFCGTGLLLLLAGYFLIANLFGATSYINSSSDEDALQNALGFVVCGFRMVSAEGELSEIPVSRGTAFAVSSDGYLLTNKHVVEDVVNYSRTDVWKDNIKKRTNAEVDERVWLFVDGEKLAAEIVYVSSSFDLAILKVEYDFARPFRLSTKEDFARAMDERAIGFPAASSIGFSKQENIAALARFSANPADLSKQFKTRDFEFVMTSGTIGLCSFEEGSNRHWIQHNAEINPGNSGGPLIATDGTVVGINTQYVEAAAGVFRSFTIPQVKEEISEHIKALHWK